MGYISSFTPPASKEAFTLADDLEGERRGICITLVNSPGFEL